MKNTCGGEILLVKLRFQFTEFTRTRRLIFLNLVSYHSLSPRNHSFSACTKFFEKLTLTPPPPAMSLHSCVWDKKYYFFGKFCVRTKWTTPSCFSEITWHLDNFWRISCLSFVYIAPKHDIQPSHKCLHLVYFGM